jgi:hypothetical protein
MHGLRPVQFRRYILANDEAWPSSVIRPPRICFECWQAVSEACREKPRSSGWMIVGTRGSRATRAWRRAPPHFGWSKTLHDRRRHSVKAAGQLDEEPVVRQLTLHPQKSACEASTSESESVTNPSGLREPVRCFQGLVAQPRPGIWALDRFLGTYLIH